MNIIINNWGPNENELLCDVCFSSSYDMFICYFRSFISFFTLCSCACAMLLCSVVFTPHHQLPSLDIKLH